VALQLYLFSAASALKRPQFAGLSAFKSSSVTKYPVVWLFLSEKAAMSATEDPMTMGGANVVVVGALQPVVDHLWQLNSLVSTEVFPLFGS